MNTVVVDLKRKSAPLSSAEHESLKKFVKSFHTVVEACEVLGVSRPVLERVLMVGSGSPKNINIIRERWSNATA